jgi:hypothetical protein
MRRKAYLIVGILFVLGLVCLAILKAYSLEIVQVAVMEAVVQKAPDGYPESIIRATFSRSLAEAKKKQRRPAYMKKLLRIAHSIERLQYLDAREVDELLDRLSCD